MAHLIDTLSWGGAQKLLVTFAEAAREQGFTPTVISLRPRDDAPFYAELELLGVEVVIFPCRRLFAPRQIGQLIRFLHQKRFAILHTHLSHANILGALVGRLTHTPVVASLHNTREHKRRFHAIRELLETLALRYGVRRVIAVGDVVAEAQQPRLGNKALDTIPNAVGSIAGLPPQERIALRQELAGDPARPILLSVGRLAMQKGYADLCHAFAIVQQAHPSTTLLIAGAGELQAELAELIRTLGLSESIRLLGPRSDVPRLLAAADLYVSAAHWEGLPIAVLEAMAAGLPVIATNVGDVPRVLVDGTGLTVPPHQPEALATAMSQMLNDPQRMRRYGAAAQAHVYHTYSPHVWLEQLLTLYREVLTTTPHVRSTRPV